MKKLQVVALHEFRAAVLRQSFVWMTLGMPVIFLAYLALVSGMWAVVLDDEISARRGALPVGLVDLTDSAAPERAFRPFSDLEEGQQALAARAISALVVLPPDWLESGRYDLYLREYRWTSSAQALDARLHQRMLAKAGVDEALLRRLEQGSRARTWELSEDGRFVEVDLLARLSSLAVPLVTTLGLAFALAMNASGLLSSVAEEKENKMMDVLLSSAPADALLFGKVLGIVTAGVLQLVIWGVLMGAGVLLLAAWSPAGGVLEEVRLGQLGLALLFSLLAFLLYGVLLVGLGSFGSSFRDSQQLAVVVILVPLLPFVATPLFLSDANGLVPRLLTFFPPTTAPAMILRLAAGSPPWAEVAISLGVLLLSIVGTMRISAKLFRTGTLLYGKKVGFTTVLRALWEPL